jgi:hypothetical protein
LTPAVTLASNTLISRIAALDVSDEWAADGAALCAHWVAAALDTKVSTARSGYGLR